ncbi:MAG TPA: SDR family oxidoreductase [Nitrospira sp.]|nr:SDR family oxidoreductase [Nitrospira sp.]
MIGGSGGIGRGICLAFAEAGWFVAIHYHRGKAAAEATLKAVYDAGGDGNLYQTDIRDAYATTHMVQAVCRDHEHLSAFVCNAGIAGSALVLRQREDGWSDVIATNLTGVFHCLRAIGPFLTARGGGSIVVIGSHAAFHGAPGQAAYASSKAGLVGLVKTAALEWGPRNVRVNLVLPGWHDTALAHEVLPRADGYADHALGRPPSLREMARTVVHLAESPDVSGQIWNCDSRHL